MKNLIEYYYSLEVSNLRKYGNDYVFNYNNRMFIFYSIKENMNIDFSYNLYKNHMNNGIFHSFIFNIDKKLLTFDGSRDRVLLLINIKYNKKLDLADILYFANTNMLQSYNFKPNWGDLWTSKVDFLEYYLGKNDNINDKVKILCYYYIGMAENAIMYFNNIDLANNKNFFNFSLTHKRIKPNDTFIELYNPMNIVIDHFSRDISEYLKSNYNDIDVRYVFNLLKKNIFCKIDYELLIARILFPSFFFDALDNFYNGIIDINEILEYYNYTNNYEFFLKKIFVEIKQTNNIDIPMINWMDN